MRPKGVLGVLLDTQPDGACEAQSGPVCIADTQPDGACEAQGVLGVMQTHSQTEPVRPNRGPRCIAWHTAWQSLWGPTGVLGVLLDTQPDRACEAQQGS